MANIVTAVLQCGAFVLIPMSSFALGLWLIAHFVGFENRWTMILVALLIGLIFFEGSLVGMLIDPRASLSGLFEKVRIASIIGLVAFIFVLIFTPVFRGLSHIFKQ